MSVHSPQGEAQYFRCPRCDQPMSPVKAYDPTFHDGMGFGSEELLICFNNQCPPYVAGWESVANQAGRIGSVRCYTDPTDGCGGVLPVGSPDALRGDMISPASQPSD